MEGSCAERGRVAPEPQAERAHGAQVCRMPTVTGAGAMLRVAPMSAPQGAEFRWYRETAFRPKEGEGLFF